MTSDATTGSDSSGAGALNDITVSRQTGGKTALMLVIVVPSIVLFYTMLPRLAGLLSSMNLARLVAGMTVVIIVGCIIVIRRRRALIAASEGDSRRPIKVIGFCERFISRQFPDAHRFVITSGNKPSP